MRWVAILGLVVVAEAVLGALAFVYVVVYSYWLNPGQAESFYQQQARLYSPWVSIVTGLPVFFVLARWLGKGTGRRAAAGNAIALWAVWAILDTTILMIAGGPGAIRQLFPVWLASNVTKLIGACAGVFLFRPPRSA